MPRHRPGSKSELKGSGRCTIAVSGIAPKSMAATAATSGALRAMCAGTEHSAGTSLGAPPRYRSVIASIGGSLGCPDDSAPPRASVWKNAVPPSTMAAARRAEGNSPTMKRDSSEALGPKSWPGSGANGTRGSRAAARRPPMAESSVTTMALAVATSPPKSSEAKYDDKLMTEQWSGALSNRATNAGSKSSTWLWSEALRCTYLTMIRAFFAASLKCRFCRRRCRRRGVSRPCSQRKCKTTHPREHAGNNGHCGREQQRRHHGRRRRPHRRGTKRISS